MKYKEWLQSHHSSNTAANYYGDVQSFKKVVDKSPQQVTVADIENWLVTFSQPTTKNRKLCAIRSWLQFHGHNTGDKVKSFKVNRKYKEIPKEDELERLIDATKDPMYKALFYIYISTGVRRSGILESVRGDYNGSAIRLVNKGGDDVIKPLTKRAKELLDAYLDSRSDNNPYLFKGRSGAVSATTVHRKFKEALKVAGLSDSYTLHTLRHAYINKLLANGVGLEVVQQLANHKSVETTTRYVAKVENEREVIENVFS